MSYYAQQEAEFWAWADEQLNLPVVKFHATPASRKWIVWLLPPEGEPFKIPVDVTAGYLGQGEAAQVEQHCAQVYPDHITGEMWPTN